MSAAATTTSSSTGLAGAATPHPAGTGSVAMAAPTARPKAITAGRPAQKQQQQQREPGFGMKLLTAGTAACVADLLTFPLDTAKVRLQVQGESALSTAAAASVAVSKQPLVYKGVGGTVISIARQEGPKALYNGIVPGLQRQMAFSAIRLGAYENVRNYLQKTTQIDSGAGLVLVRICAGITTGAMAIMCAQPTDVVKVRMQAEVKQIGQRSRYKGVVDAYVNIAKNEGLRGMYKGAMPNIARTAIINVGEIVVYDIAKEALVQRQLMRDAMPCHLVAGAMAGFVATLVASPVDVVKTRFMNSPDGRYRGGFHCALETLRNEGVLAFYKGFNASFSRLVAWNICLWITYEQLKLQVLSYYNRN